MLHKILCVLLLLQMKIKDGDSSVTSVLNYVPSSDSLEGYNKNLNNISSLLTIRPIIVMVQLLEAIRKAEKLKDGAVGKVDDAKDEVVDKANDAKEGVQNAGNKIKKIFK